MCGPSMKEGSDELYDGTLENKYVSELFPSLTKIMKVAGKIVVFSGFVLFIVSK